MNCPELHLECDNLCGYQHDDTCHSPYWNEPKSIFDLMSHRELVEYIKAQVEPQAPWDKKQWDEVTQLKGMVLHLNNKVKELQVKRKPKKTSKYA